MAGIIFIEWENKDRLQKESFLILSFLIYAKDNLF
jgi:hypothetical protein